MIRKNVALLIAVLLVLAVHLSCAQGKAMQLPVLDALYDTVKQIGMLWVIQGWADTTLMLRDLVK